jgi:hypothetical protein
MTVAIPHVQTPLVLNALTGRPTYCEQDSPEDVASGILNIVSCTKGQDPYDPNFGIDSFGFEQLPLQVADIIEDITAYETRLSNLSVTDQVLTVQGVFDARGTTNISITGKTGG